MTTEQHSRRVAEMKDLSKFLKQSQDAPTDLGKLRLKLEAANGDPVKIEQLRRELESSGKTLADLIQ